MGQSDFVSLMAPWAKLASQQTGLDSNLIMAQWGNETGWGTSYQWTHNYNPAGIGITSDAVQGQGYGSIGGGVQAYVDFVKNNSRYQAVIHAGDPTAQAIAMGNSGWAAGKYDSGSGPGSSLLSIMGTLGSSVNNAEAMTSTGATSSTGAGGGTTSTTAPAAQAAPQSSTNINGQTYTGTQGNVSALSSIESTLAAYGFAGPDLKTLTDWSWGEITTNTDPAQVVLDLQTPGSAAYPVFQKQFPGFTTANQELTSNGLKAISVADYQGYQTAAMQIAQAAGFPPGFVSKGNIGVWIGGNVSLDEFKARAQDALALGTNSTPDQQSAFNAYFGVQDNNPYLGVNLSGHGPITPGQIAALALDPMTAEPLIHQQITAAQIGGSGVTAGVGAISKDEAVKLAQAGVPGGVSFKDIAPLAPLEQSLVGQTTNAAQNTLTPDQLVEGNLLGTYGDVRAQQVAQESRKAPFSGGGGDVAAASGVVGAGSASPGSKTGQ